MVPTAIRFLIKRQYFFIGLRRKFKVIHDSKNKDMPYKFRLNCLPFKDSLIHRNIYIYIQ